ncbi:helix-turn-helix domain-containing protein [Vreelandella azerica]|nr:helix-turn-helix domain-containing protein [Halomonas azerica]
MAQKWGKPTRDAGWTSIPNILIYRQKTLGLDSLDLNILLHLMTYWWQNEQKPYPSKATLAKSIGVTSGTIQKRIRAMEAGGLIKRIQRRRENNRSDTNEYDLSPLRDALVPHAEEELRERKKKHTERQKRKTTVNKPSTT